MHSTSRQTWPTGLPRSLHYPAVPVGSILRGSARRYRDRVAIRHGQVQVTFQELWDQACAFANALAGHGVGPGHTVMMHMPNCPEYAVAYFGTLLSGATFSPANPLLPAEPLQSQMSDCAAVVVVTHANAAVPVRSVAPNTVRLVVQVGGASTGGQTDFDDFVASGETSVPPAVAIDVDSTLAHISYTGGTTGLSKGVELTHRNVVSNALQYACWNHGAVTAVSEAGDVILDQVGSAEEWPVRLGTGVMINLTPWFHAMGCIGSLTVPLLAGATIILHDRFEPGSYLADAEKWHVTSMSGAPAMFAALLATPDLSKRDLSSVRALSSGAGPLPHDHLRRLGERFPDAVLCEGYGLTEATMGVTLNPTARSSIRKPGTVGIPVFDTEILIVDPETLTPCSTGQPGEICVRGPQVMVGYHNREVETQATLRGGWLHTGDLGVLDEEGYLTVVDRLKDMLIYKGYNVYPRELEELLIAHPSVRAAAVVGRPDAAVGELPVAFVVPNGEDLDEAQLSAEVNAQLLPYKRIRELIVVDQIPVSAAGKILKRELRERLT
jgi:long-chain acyl-CoA synthetase